MLRKATPWIIVAVVALALGLPNDARAELPKYMKDLKDGGAVIVDAIDRPGAPSNGGGALRGQDEPGDDNVVVPEPGTIALLGLGLGSLAAMRRKKAQKS